MNVKPNQHNLVLSILESANCGPNTTDSMLLWNACIEEAGRLHVEFVVEQLVHAGCLTRTTDGRWMTTQEGERYIWTQTQHVA